MKALPQEQQAVLQTLTGRILALSGPDQAHWLKVPGGDLKDRCEENISISWNFTYATTELFETMLTSNTVHWSWEENLTFCIWIPII